MNDTILNRRQSTGEANSEPVVRKLQLLRVGSFQFGIFADETAGIAAWQKPTPLPHAPKSVLGVVSIQGRMLTVLDLAVLVAGEVSPGDKPPQHLIALRGDEQLALAVTAVEDTLEISEADFNALEVSDGTLTRGVFHREGAEIKILNLKDLFQAAIQGRERRRRRF